MLVSDLCINSPLFPLNLSLDSLTAMTAAVDNIIAGWAASAGR